MRTLGTISTVAGNGTRSFSGDGGDAMLAQLYFPYGVALDAAGNLFMADTVNHSVRKVDVGGTITTVAGTGTQGFSGDGAAATTARLSRPQRVRLDAAGNLYIADRSNHRIRKVDATGMITTVAGNGTPGFSGDGGAATAAQLRDPFGVALDAAGNLYIADTFNNRIRKVDASSGVISTVAGTGTSGFSGDGGAATAAQLGNSYDVASDAAGNLYIADTTNQRIRRVDAASGVISTVAGNGTQGSSGDEGDATLAQLLNPQGVALDAAGNLYIADSSNHRIRKVSATGTITTVAGTGAAGYSGAGGAATAAQLNFPYGVALDAAGNLYIADANNQRIRRVLGVGAMADLTPPVITPVVTGTLGNDGWYVSDVEVSWSVTDPESSILSQDGCEPVTVTEDTESVTFTCTAISSGGTTEESVTIRRDATPPAW
jgi:sugar lactone lactonase YvrE